MKKSIKYFLFSAAFMWASLAIAEIDPGAASASHKLETAAEEIHGYLHHHYSGGYGSHELEHAAAEVHHLLHEYGHGTASEADVVAAQDALKSAWNNFRQTLIPAGLLNSGDAMLSEKYQMVKDSYKDLRFLLRKAK